MNCPQCQEQLDERLDELRPGLRSGALSPDDARSQAQKALQEAVSQCAECEGELREHLALRLSLMMPDAEVAEVVVPPALRANVRRALERESASRTYSARNPFKGFVWTGGAVLSAVVLFIVARPFLMERAQQTPFPATDSTSSSAPSLSQSAAPKMGKTSPTAKNGSLVPLPPTVGAHLTTPKPRKEMSASSVAKPPLPPPVGAMMPPSQPQTSHSAQPTTPANDGEPSPRTRVGGSVRERVRPQPRDTTERPTTSPRATLPTPPPSMPMVGSSGPIKGAMGKHHVDSSAPIAPRLDPDLLAPSGKALGLTVRFVPASSSATGGSRASQSPRSLYTAPAPAPGAPAPQGVTPPMVGMAAPPATNNAVGEGATKPATPVSPSTTARAMRPRVGSAPPSMSDSATGSAESTNSTSSKAVEEGILFIAVNEAVTNARVLGKVQGRAGQGVVLWSGNAPAHKPIEVPIEPLAANKGDTVDVSFQQQVSLGETKTLATTSVVVP